MMFDDEYFQPPGAWAYFVRSTGRLASPFEIWHPAFGRIFGPRISEKWTAVVLWALRTGRPVSKIHDEKIDDHQWDRYCAEFAQEFGPDYRDYIAQFIKP